MSKIQSKENKQKKIKGRFFRVVIITITSLLAFLTLIIPEILKETPLSMQVGEVTSQDILAPYNLSFESEVLTEKARQEAAAKIDPIYFPPDPSIGRHQIEKLKSVLYYISTVRQDPYAAIEIKVNDLVAIEDLKLSSEVSKNILLINDDRWQVFEAEAASVLEEVMRNTIRSTNITLIKNSVPSIIDFSFPEEQAKIIVDLVTPFVIPNSLFSEEMTEAARQQESSLIDPVIRSYISGETLVRRGQIVDQEDWELLDQYGLIQEENQYQKYISSAIIIIVFSLFVIFYFLRRKLNELNNNTAILLIAVTFLVFLAITRFFIIDRTVVPYVFPMAAFGLTLSIIFNIEAGMVFSIVLGVLAPFGTSRGFELALFYTIPSIIGILTIGKSKRIANFFGAGVAIGLVGIGIVLAFRLGDSLTDWIGIASLSAVSLINGIASAGLTLLLQFAYSQLLDITTPLQLLDTARPDHPLLQFMLRNAPGSYQHSLQVSNLAEHAAEAIGADTLLVRVGAIYHDCGKAVNPQFFIENQVKEKIDSHDDIDPATAAATIIQHVTDGVELAKKYRLPTRIIDFIKEHHGTLLTQYQYTQAIKEVEDPEDVDIQLFKYPGPPPRSRETALLMLSDGMEARARAEQPKDEIELKVLIAKVIDYYRNQNQLNNTDLTLKDLEVIADSFFITLRGIYHPRIQYPAISTDKNYDKSVKTEKVSSKQNA